MHAIVHEASTGPAEPFYTHRLPAGAPPSFTNRADDDLHLSSMPNDVLQLLHVHLSLSDRVRLVSTCRTLAERHIFDDDRAASRTIQSHRSAFREFARNHAEDHDGAPLLNTPDCIFHYMIHTKHRNIGPFTAFERAVETIGAPEARVVLLCDLAETAMTLPERMQTTASSRLLSEVHQIASTLPPAAMLDAEKRAFKARRKGDIFSPHRVRAELDFVLQAIEKYPLTFQGRELEKLYTEVPTVYHGGYDLFGTPNIVTTEPTTIFTDAVRQKNDALWPHLRGSIPPVEDSGRRDILSELFYLDV